MSDVLQRVRDANPIFELDDVDAAEFEMALAAIEYRWDFGAEPPRIPAARPHGWLRPALVAVGAALLVILVIAAPVLFLRGEEQPVTDTTIPAVTTTAQVVTPTLPVTTTSPTPTTAPVPVALAPPMIWERVPHQPIFEGAEIFRVVNGGPGLVAVGSLGDWNTFDTFGLADGGAQAVVYVSPDGYEWERIDSPAYVADTYTAMWDVAVGPDGLLVAPGQYGNETVLYLSSDGITWERIVPEGFAWDVIGTETGFLGFGKVIRAEGFGEDAAVWLSSDGREWTRIEDDAFLATEEDDWTVGISGVTAGGPGLVAIGTSGLSGGTGTGMPGVDRMTVWVSADGMEWERLADLEEVNPGTVSGDPESGRIIAFGAHMWTSADGYTWMKTEQEDPRIQPRWWASLAWDGERVVAGGGDVNLSLWTSGNRGENWSRIDPNDPAFDGHRPTIASVVQIGHVFVAVGQAGEYTQEVGAVWIGTWDE